MIKKLLDLLKDAHVPIGLLIFIVGSVIHIYHGLDASFVSFTTVVLGFLGSHAYINRDQSDKQ